MKTTGQFCVNVPNSHQVRNIDVSYNGRGTQSGDVVITGIVLGLLVLALAIASFAIVKYRAVRHGR